MNRFKKTYLLTFCLLIILGYQNCGDIHVIPVAFYSVDIIDKESPEEGDPHSPPDGPEQPPDGSNVTDSNMINGPDSWLPVGMGNVDANGVLDACLLYRSRGGAGAGQGFESIGVNGARVVSFRIKFNEVPCLSYYTGSNSTNLFAWVSRAPADFESIRNTSACYGTISDTAGRNLKITNIRNHSPVVYDHPPCYLRSEQVYYFNITDFWAKPSIPEMPPLDVDSPNCNSTAAFLQHVDPMLAVNNSILGSNPGVMGISSHGFECSTSRPVLMSPQSAFYCSMLQNDPTQQFHTSPAEAVDRCRALGLIP